jgi:hypothetical protein
MEVETFYEVMRRQGMTRRGLAGVTQAKYFNWVEVI